KSTVLRFWREEGYEVRHQDRTAAHDVCGHARCLAGRRRHRAVRVGVDVRPLLSDLFRLDRPMHGGLGHHDGPRAGDQAHPRPPLVIGGGGEKRTLRAVARWGDHWNFPGGGVEVFNAKREVLAKHCADIGRDMSEITTSTHLRYDPSNMQGLVDEAGALGEA